MGVFRNKRSNDKKLLECNKNLTRQTASNDSINISVENNSAPVQITFEAGQKDKSPSIICNKEETNGIREALMNVEGHDDDEDQRLLQMKVRLWRYYRGTVVKFGETEDYGQARDIYIHLIRSALDTVFL